LRRADDVDCGRIAHDVPDQFGSSIGKLSRGLLGSH
jgi:hypothetical protein